MAAIFRSWEQYDRTLLVIPTAGGKTIVFAEIAQKRLEVGRVLLLAHTEELIDQARDKMRRANGLESDLEKAENRASLESPLVVSSMQTLSRQARLERFAPDHFQTIILDEAHHCLSPSYRRIIEYFGNAKRKYAGNATPPSSNVSPDKRYLPELWRFSTCS